MEKYELRNGFEISEKLLDELENERLSEGTIAKQLGINAATLWRVRKKMNWPKKQNFMGLRADENGKHSPIDYSGAAEYQLPNGQMITQDQLDKMEAEKMSEEEIANHFGISRISIGNIRRKTGWLKKLGRSDKGKVKLSPSLKKQRRNEYMRDYYAANPDKRYKTMQHPITGKIVAMHRYVMEEHLGRPLKDGEVVDHIDGDRFNNAIENLRLFSSQSEHIKSHIAEDPSFRQALKDNSRRYEYDGMSLTIAEWAVVTGINRDTLHSRIEVRFWPIADALTIPVGKYINYHERKLNPKFKSSNSLISGNGK